MIHQELKEGNKMRSAYLRKGQRQVQTWRVSPLDVVVKVRDAKSGSCALVMQKVHTAFPSARSSRSGSCREQFYARNLDDKRLNDD